MTAGPVYREVEPPDRLAAEVECLWAIETGAGHPGYLVLPDACTDVLMLPAAGGAVGLVMVGTMTRRERVVLTPGQRLLGVRFRPGMARRHLPVPATELTDRMVPLDVAWGRGALALERRVAGAATAEQALDLLAAALPSPSAPAGVVQRLCGWLVARRGQVRVDDLAAHAGLSARQLRRLFLEQTGVGPKYLARILRFRHAAALAAASPHPDWSSLAADAGYTDQAHLIHEFALFAGCTPRQLTAGTGR